MPTGLGDELLWLCPSLDDSPNDLSGNNNGGTYKNGTGTVVDSDPVYNGSRAYSFDGSDDYILTGSQAINSKQLSRSWSLWFKTNGQIGTVSYGAICSKIVYWIWAGSKFIHSEKQRSLSQKDTGSF